MRKPGSLKKSDAVYCLEIKRSYAAMRKSSKTQSLAVSPSARCDLTPSELSPCWRVWAGFWAVPVGHSLLVPCGLCPVLLCPCASPQPCFIAQVPYFLHSLLPQWLIVLLTVSAVSAWCASVLCSLWQCSGSLLHLPARSWQGWRRQLRQGSNFRGLHCIPAWGSAPFPSAVPAPASRSKQCQVTKSFCLCFGLKSLSLLPAVVQQPRNL